MKSRRFFSRMAQLALTLFGCHCVLCMTCKSEDLNSSPAIDLKKNEVLSIKYWGIEKKESTIKNFSHEETVKLIVALAASRAPLPPISPSLSSYSVGKNNNVSYNIDVPKIAGMIVVHDKQTPPKFGKDQVLVFIGADGGPVHRYFSHSYSHDVAVTFKNTLKGMIPDKK